MLFVENSKNSKISSTKQQVAATYAPILQTCPDSCNLKGAGCYAETSYTGMTNRKLENLAAAKSALDLAKDEAAAIDSAFSKGVPQTGANGGVDLRLHVSGDCKTTTAARTVAAAARRFARRGGGSVWSYTHAWRTVPRNAWEGVSILASVESLKDSWAARKRGYAPAIVVSEHKSDKLYRLGNSKFIPCPAQTRGVTCVTCRLCFNADRLHAAGIGIAFKAHGAKRNELKRKLTVI